MMWDVPRDEGFTPFGSSLLHGTTRMEGMFTGFAALTPVTSSDSYVIKPTGRDLWMSATAAQKGKGRKRVAFSQAIDAQPSFGLAHGGGPTAVIPSTQAQKGLKVKTSLDPAEMTDYEGKNPVKRGQEPHSKLTNRIRLQLSGDIQ